MTKEQKEQLLKEQLQSTDYIALKATEGCDMGEYGDWKGERQSLRDEINRVAAMTEEEYEAAYPEENAEDRLNADILGE